MTQPPKPAPCVHCGQTEACHAKRGVDYINISDEGRCPRYRSIDGAQVGWLHTTYTPEPPAAEKLEGVTPEMQAAYVEYDPPGEIGMDMRLPQILGQIRSAFYAGWLARTTTPAPSEPSECLMVCANQLPHDCTQGKQPAPSPDIIRDSLQKAAQGILDRMSDTYQTRRGLRVGIEADDGEKCWIVHSDDIEDLRRALAALPTRDARDALDDYVRRTTLEPATRDAIRAEAFEEAAKLAYPMMLQASGQALAAEAVAAAIRNLAQGGM